MTSQILAEDISWTPWSRLNLQVGFNYVWSELTTPASDVTSAILNAQNNYWMINFNSSFVLNDKTDLNVGYLYYRANNYEDNSSSGVPYGAGAEEHGITAGLVRRISKNIRLSLRYGYYHYTDDTFGGNGNYEAHVLYSSLSYRF
jgi:outer membrane protein assembly factor BamA